MQLIRHISASDTEYVSEWSLADAVFIVRWRLPGSIDSIQLRARESSAPPTHPPATDLALLTQVYGQLLVAAGMYLSLDDALQEFIVMERMTLESQLLNALSWRDDRPTLGATITQIGSKA